MRNVFGYESPEKSACGVGFVVSLDGEYSHDLIKEGLHALRCVEHRGACGADGVSSDGAGLMTEIPFELLGYARGMIAVATIFVTPDPEMQRKLLQIFEDTFGFFDMPILSYRQVPVNRSVLGPQAAATIPHILQAIIKRPYQSNTDAAFNRQLYNAQRMTFTKQKKLDPVPQFFMPSLSVNTIVYKALTAGAGLDAFYLDLQQSSYKTRFAMFHRRFSTNTVTSWDKAQPFRLVAHNGEINTIAGNRSWAYSREKSVGLPRNELITHEGISDSGSLNEMVEALMYRSSLPYIEDALALMMPPAEVANAFYKFWSRAMEPWDGPALVTYSDGQIVGARLDRNGFRPCRWVLTENRFYLASEAGAFAVEPGRILSKGALGAGSCVNISLGHGQVDFKDPSQSRENRHARFDTRLFALGYQPGSAADYRPEHKFLFQLTQETWDRLLLPMVKTGKEAIGSMGDTARLAILSDEPRSFFDYFFQNFAQVTNPPLDYLREKLVTDLSVYLGARPNIFISKELTPLKEAIEISSPLLSLGQLACLARLGQPDAPDPDAGLKSATFSMTFQRQYGAVDCQSQLDRLAREVIAAVEEGVSIIILSDRDASWERLPIPVLLVLRHLVMALDKAGLRLWVSLVVDSAQIQTTHHVAATVAFGASAICPYLVLQLAHAEAEGCGGTPDGREQNLLRAFESGFLKVMAKMGISVARSYQSSRLFAIIGLDKHFSHTYFRGVPSLVGGLTFADVIQDVLQQASLAQEAWREGVLPNAYLFREHSRGLRGERHAMTAARSKLVHRAVRAADAGQWEAYQDSFAADLPVSVRHLLDLAPPGPPAPLEDVEPAAALLARFGAGAMSFGAISAEAQRDIILAMQAIGGRSNSGEGGENPYYWSDGLTTTTKQLASGRFGVTAVYLVSASEFQIKIAQGAKPGEGGQLMASKVNADIARARHSVTHVDLISPPPQHDIYSIEDLKQLIYELKQIKPQAKVSVKLVSGVNVGTIAVGVAKAGADIVHIAGHDGGTGAATLSSMKHCGLPFEFGLAEAHQALCDNNLRHQVTLRADGGLHTGRDVVIAALLGADEFDFGKLLLVAGGCIMARVCEKNTCPRGIATHDPKFKALYQGQPEHIVSLLQQIAAEIRRDIAALGFTRLDELVGRTDCLRVHPRHQELVRRKKLDLSFALRPAAPVGARSSPGPAEASPLNRQIVQDAFPALQGRQALQLEYPISTQDRAVPATLAGHVAAELHRSHLSGQEPPAPSLELSFTGSAGQSFGVFTVPGLTLRLCGEANDSVAKAMSGGKVVIRPPASIRFKAEKNVIIGNCALYGATGGTLYVRGLAGDRFAVRNSGALAVVEGTGLHPCEYMTNGTVVILGPIGKNLGSGMTGGRIFLFGEVPESHVNLEYIAGGRPDESDEAGLQAILQDYLRETGSETAATILAYWADLKKRFRKYLPLHLVRRAGLAEEAAQLG